MNIDLAGSLRRLKPERWMGTLSLRPDAEVNFVDGEPRFGPHLLLDTCVYLDALVHIKTDFTACRGRAYWAYGEQDYDGLTVTGRNRNAAITRRLREAGSAA